MEGFSPMDRRFWDLKRLDLVRRGGRVVQEVGISRILEQALKQMQVLAHRMLGRYPGVARWEQTDDVVQNAMLRLQRALSSIEADDVRSFAGLVATQVRRELIDLARHHRSPASDASRHETAVLMADGRLRERVTEAVACDESPGVFEAWERFHATADGLPAEERELFHLVWHLGLTQPQAADVLGCSLRTIKRRWSDVKARLRAACGDDSPEA